MARFTLGNDCPCAYELFPASRKLARKYKKETGDESVLFQTDWEYPDLAQSLGWSIHKVQIKGKRCDHSSTDGTVTCKCGVTASMFIDAATEWLDAHIGHSFNDRYGIISAYFGW